MNKHFTALAQVTLVTALLLPIQAIACELHNDPSLQNSFGQFHLPAVGNNAENITQVYGEPLRKLNGINGMKVWDYGSFRVMFKNSRVTFAGLW